MKKRFFLKQLDYELWANQMLIETISKNQVTEQRVHELLAHLLIIPNNWLNKALNEPPNFKSWDTLTLDDCVKLLKANHEGWKKFISNRPAKGLKQDLIFQFMGETSIISIEDLLIHLVNHSTYHRGQIMVRLKEKTDQIPLITYIAFATKKA